MKIFVCFYKTSLLACNCFQIWGGDDSILCMVELRSTKTSFNIFSQKYFQMDEFH
jgi:hypothetical protein